MEEGTIVGLTHSRQTLLSSWCCYTTTVPTPRSEAFTSSFLASAHGPLTFPVPILTAASICEAYSSTGTVSRAQQSHLLFVLPQHLGALIIDQDPYIQDLVITEREKSD